MLDGVIFLMTNFPQQKLKLKLVKMLKKNNDTTTNVILKQLLGRWTYIAQFIRLSHLLVKMECSRCP